MINFILYIIAPLIAALLLRNNRIERAVTFLWSGLLASYITLGIQPWVNTLLIQFIPDADQMWCPVISLPAVCLVLFLVFFVAFSTLAVPKEAEEIKYPKKAAKFVAFVCIFCGMLPICGTFWLGLSALPYIDKVPMLKQQDVENVGQSAATKCVSLVQFGNPPTTNQRIWFSLYPVTVYISNGGNTEAIERVAPEEKKAPSDAEVAAAAAEKVLDNSDPGAIAKLKASRRGVE